jgi:hypothetical protein
MLPVSWWYWLKHDLMEKAVSNLPVVRNDFSHFASPRLYKQIDWNDWFENFKEGNCAAVSVDCTDFHVQET